MTARFHYPVLAFTIALLISGCAATDTVKTTPTPITPPAAETAPEEPIVYGQFRPDTLYALLSAEIAGQRNRFDIALRNYVQQAELTRDAGVIERAMDISEFLGAHPQALQMALLWTEVEPENPDALRAGALHLARAGEHQQAMAMMEKVLLLQDDTHFDLLALTALQADQATRSNMLETLLGLLDRHPDNAQLSFSAALLLQEEQRTDEALALLKKHTRRNHNASSIMLLSRLYAGQGDLDAALNTLQQGVREFPNDNRIRLVLARMLVDNGEPQAALVHFRELSRQNPEDNDVRLALALIELDMGETNSAIQDLETLLQMDPEHSAAAYHLGGAYEQKGQWDSALHRWQSIGAGDEYLASRLRMARLLTERERFKELTKTMRAERSQHPKSALELYLIEIESLTSASPETAMLRANEALQQFENNSNLLYTRAILSERLGNPAGSEADLRQIIALEPENAMALNALGYTLADRNEKLDEALELIQQAAELKPDDPAILDSLGWVYYRLGELKRAEQLLREAFAAFPDAEVGAHLGEVLWELGNHREARTIWREAADGADDTSLIDATRKRLKAH